MREGFRVVDADRHVIEPVEMWKEYLDPAFRDHAPTLEAGAWLDSTEERVARLGAKGLLPAPPRLMLHGEPIMHMLSERAQLELILTNIELSRALHAAMSPEGQLREMDRSGIDVALLYPTYASYLVAIDSLNPAISVAFARAYNDWLHDFCRRDPLRLRGVALISRHDPGEMVAELRRVVGFGWRAAVVRPNPVKGRLLGDPAYEPFWAECERLGVAIAVHEGSHARLPTAGADRFESRFSLHACSHPMEQMMAFLSLLEGGVLERYPSLRFAFLEAGCGWLPYWLWRLDEVEYKKLAGEVAENVRMAPSAYFRRQCAVVAEPGEPLLAEVIGLLGEERMLFGTDFPHPDHDEDAVAKVVRLSCKVSAGALDKMLWSNAARFFGMTNGALELLSSTP